jgi:hypothetical protein
MSTANYQRIIKNTGEIFEMCGTYETQDNIVSNAPDMLTSAEQDMIMALMRKNGIKRLDVIV